jgi:hypothetical protein
VTIDKLSDDKSKIEYITNDKEKMQKERLKKRCKEDEEEDVPEAKKQRVIRALSKGKSAK